MNRLTAYWRMIIVGACGLALIACGGGGGSGGGSSGLSYTGLTTPAAVTETNGEQIVGSAYTSGQSSGAMGSVFLAVAAPNANDTPTGPRIPTVVTTMEKIVNRINPAAVSSNVSSTARATQTDSGTENGACGGTGAYSLRYDDVSGDFSGSITFSNYCAEGGVTVNGAVTLAGTIDTGSLQVSSMSMTFDTVTFRVGSDSFSLDGDITATTTSSTSVDIVVDMKVEDAATSKVYWLDNYTMSITTGVSSQQVSINGRFYEPDYGYVDITTPTPLYIAGTDEWPSTGVLLATGANNAKAKVTVVDNTSYNLEVDADGDDVYEIQQNGLLWANL